MSAAVELFDFRGEHHVRVLRDVDGEPLFVLADICRALEISDVSIVRRRLDDALCQAHPILDSLGRMQQVTVISESGMYEVVIRSDKPQAVVFRRWITTEVLPAIRKTGTYSQYPAAPTALPSKRELAQMVIEAEDRADAEARARVEAESRAKELEAPASAWSHMAESTGDYEVSDAAKVLSRDPNITVGRDRLFRYMQAEGWIFRNQNGRWKAYQAQVDRGRLVEKLGRPFLHEPSGEMRLPDPTIRITAKGLAELHKRLGGTDQIPLVAAS